MARTAREYCLSFILLGILIVVVIMLIPFFGPKPLSNPIASIILFTVLIISCCLLSFNRVIIAHFKKRKNKVETKNNLLHCPKCGAAYLYKENFCPNCGAKMEQF